MTSTPRKAERANGVATRQRILEVAATMFGATGYEATSLRQIAAAAGVNLATLKYHFGDKPALFSDVYRSGHEQLVAVLAPVVQTLGRVQSAEELAERLHEIVGQVFDYMTDNHAFVRLTLFRMLEESSDAIDLEMRLQGDAIALIELALSHLQERGIARAVDTRALVVHLMTALPAWFIAASGRPDWFGDEAHLKAAFVAFFGDLLRQNLVS
ncbi:MAG: TetR/AcrR family transcriptional regulator [Myxococcales bacterium]|nr:TetR/AcrR family transcriptional regulator [Myxococcales bacterium]